MEPVPYPAAHRSAPRSQVDGEESVMGEGTVSRRQIVTGVTGAVGLFALAATGTDGKRVEQTVKFTTVKQSNFTAPIFKLTNGGTYGVGQPVVVRWDEKIPDRAAAEKTLTVTTSPQVDGGWNWISDQELHWRGKDLWKPGTTVTVNAKAYGVHMGKGLYGEKDASVSIKIGPSRVAVV